MRFGGSVVKEVTSSHVKGKTVILSAAPLDEQALRETLNATGYTVRAVSSKPAERRGLFGAIGLMT